MNKPSDAVIDEVAPPHDIDGISIQDSGIRNVANATHDPTKTLRIPRGGAHDVALLATVRTYDGANGGVPSTYLSIWLEFQASGSRWRTPGVTVQNFEAKRVARDLSKGKFSAPARGEPTRSGGKVIAREDSSLMGRPIEGGTYLLFIRCASKGKSEEWARTRGVELTELEVPIIVAQLKKLAATA